MTPNVPTGSLTFTYDLEAELSAPTGGVLESITARVEVDPPYASCLIYGRTKDGDTTSVQVTGHQVVDLPFCEPKVWIKYLIGCNTVRIQPMGWRDRRDV